MVVKERRERAKGEEKIEGGREAVREQKQERRKQLNEPAGGRSRRRQLMCVILSQEKT